MVAQASSEARFIIGNGTYSINGEIKTDAAPYIKDGRTFLPLRYAAYAVGIGDNSIAWQDDIQTAILCKAEKTIAITPGENRILVLQNGEVSQTLLSDAAPEIVQGRVMLPIRAIAESLDCDVQWDGPSQTAIIKMD